MLIVYSERSYPTGEELWTDFDGDEHILDTKEYRREWSHCFVFECCGGNLRDNPHGCEVGRHEEVKDQGSTRFKGAVSDDSEEEDEDEY